MALFFLMNNAALALRGPLLVLLTSGLGIHYVVSNIISLVALTLVRFALADTWIWAKAGAADSASGPYGYDGKTPPRDRGGVFRGSAGASAPAEHSHDNVQGGLEFRRGRCPIFAWRDCWGCSCR